MRIDSLRSSSSQLMLKGAPIIRSNGSVEGSANKSLGETPPIKLSLSQIGSLAALFAPTGLVGRLKKRLNYLKNKKCKIVPAKGTVACVDNNDIVYLGVDFLQKYQNEPETIAGVLAHEWGHACALKPTQKELNELNWNQIFELRRAHETLADETSGRLLYLMGYSPKGIMKFLTKGKDTHNLKYHHPQIRAQVIAYGFKSEKRKAQIAKQLFKDSTYKNNYSSFLLDIA